MRTAIRIPDTTGQHLCGITVDFERFSLPIAITHLKYTGGVDKWTADKLAGLVREATSRFGLHYDGCATGHNCKFADPNHLAPSTNHCVFAGVSDSGACDAAASAKSSCNQCRCAPHSINLSFKDTIESDDDDENFQFVVGLLHRLHLVCKTVRNSAKLRDRFLYIQRELIKVMDNPTTQHAHILLTAVITRWGSTYNSISRFLEYIPQRALVLLSREEIARDTAVGEGSLFTTRERSCLSDLLRVLAGPKRVTVFLQGEHYTTLSFTYPHIHKLWLDLRSWGDNTTIHPGVRRFAQIMHGSLDRRLHVNFLRPSSYVATFLDPRLKQMTMLPRDVRLMAGEYTRDAARHESELMRREEEQRSANAAAAAAAAGAAAAASAAAEAAVAASALENEVKDGDEFEWPAYNSGSDDERDDVQEVAGPLNMEFAQYAREPALADERGPMAREDPLVWWRGRTHQLPILSRVARRYLAIPASSAAVERMFSYTGMRVSRRNNRLDTETLLDLMLQRSLQKFNEKWGPKYLARARDTGLIN